MKRYVPPTVRERIQLAAQLRNACLGLPRVYSARESELLRAFERFREGASEPAPAGLRLGLDRMFRRGEYLAMTQLAARITVRDLEVDTYLSVAEQAVEQEKLKP